MAPRLSARLLTAALIGAAAGLYCHGRLRAHPTELAHDFTYPLTAARHLIDGRNPYREMQPGGPGSFPEHGYFLYPLPTALLSLPFTVFPTIPAGAIFFGVSSALLAFAATRSGYWRLTIFASAPYIVAAWSVQWSPLLVATALMPAIGWLGIAKPNLGIASFVYAPRWSTVIGVLVLCLIALVVVPTWPRDWLATVPLAPSHSPPLWWPFGFLCLVAVLRWRTAEMRLLCALLLMPVSVWLYDHLMLTLLARSPRQLAALVLSSWAALLYILAFLPLDFTEHVAPIQRVIILGLYLPGTLLLLRHPNRGVVPAWLERAATRLPSWLRGSCGEPDCRH
jgi:hypothetical protein